MSATTLTMARSDANTQTGMLLPAMIGFYLGGRGCLTYLFFTSDARTGSAVASALNLLIFAVVVFHSFGPAPNRLSWNLRVPCFRWVLIFLGVSLSSLAWSVTVSVPVAFVYWCCMTADIAMVVLLLRTGPVEGMSRTILKGYVCGACVIACVIWLAPTMQDLRPGDDEFFSPNATGFICALGAFFAQFVSRSERSWRFPAFFLVITLLRTLSKTTIIAFAIAEMYLLIRDASISRKAKASLAVLAAMVIGAFWGLIGDYYDIYTNTGNGAQTLTGRIGIWTVVLQRSLEQPWIGHGFHSFSNVIPPFGGFEASHAHNELLQQFYAYGVVGIFMLIAVYVSFYRQLGRFAPQHKTFFSAFLLFIIVRGLADAERFEYSFPFWTITLISLMLARSSADEQMQQQAHTLAFPRADGSGA